MPQDAAGLPVRYNVGGVLLERPFRIQRLGHFGFNVDDVEASLEFYSGERGVEIRHLPQELLPGMDYTAFAIDPQGHAVQLYAYMENIGWDGKPRPPGARRQVTHGAPWPEALEPMSDEGDGEVFLGPLG